MKSKFILFVAFFLGIFIVPMQAMVEPNVSNSELHFNNTQLNKVKKSPNLLSKIVLKIAEKRFKKHTLSAKLDGTASKGDKFATYGLFAVLGSLFLFLILGIPVLSALITLRYAALIFNLSGLIASIIALTRDDLSSRGKKMAWWGIGIVCVELLVTILILLAVIIVLGNL